MSDMRTFSDVGRSGGMRIWASFAMTAVSITAVIVSVMRVTTNSVSRVSGFTEMCWVIPFPVLVVQGASVPHRCTIESAHSILYEDSMIDEQHGPQGCLRVPEVKKENG